MRITFFLIFILLSSGLQAETTKWKHFLDDVYYDENSIERNGALTKVVIRQKSYIWKWELDCKRYVYYSEGGVENRPERGAPVEKLFTEVCKKNPLVFWK